MPSPSSFSIFSGSHYLLLPVNSYTFRFPFGLCLVLSAYWTHICSLLLSLIYTHGLLLFFRAYGCDFFINACQPRALRIQAQ